MVRREMAVRAREIGAPREGHPASKNPGWARLVGRVPHVLCRDLLPSPDGRLDAVLPRCYGAGVGLVICAVWVVCHVEIDEQAAVGKRFGFQVTAGAIRLCAS